MKKMTTPDLVQTALLVALVFLATKFINIQIFSVTSGGLVHLGNAMFFISVIIFGKKKGSIAGGVGMGLFDLLSGFAIWAPFTLIIRLIMGWIIGTFSWNSNKRGNDIKFNILGIVISGVWMIVGYYIAEGIIYGNWITPYLSIPANIIQVIVGLVIAIPTSKMLKKYIK